MLLFKMQKMYFMSVHFFTKNANNYLMFFSFINIILSGILQFNDFFK